MELRQCDDVRFRVGWRPRRHLSILAVFVSFICIAIPAGGPFGTTGEMAWAEMPIEAAETGELLDLSIEELLDVNITTASRHAEKATEAPATVYVISRQDIRDRGYSTLSDVLKDLPGMETSEYYYSEQGTLVPVRGVVGNNKIVLLIDGMRVNPPGGEELMIRNDVSVRYAEQIEIIYGPGSTLYGQDAISTVINIKTKKASEQAASELLGAVGNHDSREGFASFSKKFTETSAPFSFSGFASFRRSDLSDFHDEYSTWWNHYEPLQMSAGRSLNDSRGDEGTNLFARLETENASLQVWYRNSARSTSEGSGEGGANPVLYFVDEAHWEDSSLVVEGQYALELSDQATLHSILTYNRYEIDPSSRYVFPNGLGGLYLDDFKYGLGTSVSVEEKLDYEFSDMTRATFGAVATTYDIIPKASVLGGADPDGDIVSQAGTLTYYTVANDPSSRVDINRAVDLDYQQYGFYAEGVHRFSDDLRVVGGVRVDTNSRYDETPVSPRAAIIYSGFDPRLTVKYIFSRAFVAPAPYSAFNIFDNGVQISSGNPDLEPERATSNEINLVWQDKKLLASLSFYYNKQSNLILTSQTEAPGTVVADPVYVNPDGTGERRLTQTVNGGSSETMGADFFFRYNMEAVRLWGSYSYVDFERDINGVTSGLDQISRHNARAGLTWQALRYVSVTPSLVFRSTPENLPSTYDIAGANLTNPYEVNLNVLYSPAENLDAFLTVRNLCDRHYALRGVAGPAQQEPLTYLIGLRLRY